TTLTGVPSTPLGLTATPGDAQISLGWNASAGATNYIVQRATNGGPFTTIATTSATSFVNTNLLNGTNYFYVIAAVGHFGQSPFSASADAVPMAGGSGIFWINTITTSAQSWNVNSNWSNGTAFPNSQDASAVVNSSIPANQTINLNQPITLRSLSVGTAGAAFNITANGGTLTFDNTPDDSLLRQLPASSTNTISAPFSSISGLNVVNDSANTLTLSGVISGASDISFSGDVTLSAANTAAGATVITNGTLRLANALALQNTILNFDSGNLVFSGITAATLAGLSGANSAQNLNLVNVASGPVTLTVGGNNASLSYAGQLSGTGSLVKTGTGTLTLANATYTGNTTINAASGNLTVAGGAFGSPTATVTVGLANALTVSGGNATAGNVNVGLVGGQTGASGAIAGNASASLGALTIGSGGNTAGNFSVNTTGAVSLGNVAVRRNAGAVTTPTTTAGLIISNGTVSAASVTIAQGGVGGRGADLNIHGGSLTIADSASTGKFAINSSAGNGFVTMTGGALTYLGTDGLLMSVGAGVSRLSIRGGTATLAGITLNAGNAAGVTSSLVVSNGGTLYLGTAGLVLNQPGATVFVSLGNGNATVGAAADWSSAAPMGLNGDTTFQAADAANAARNISLSGGLSGSGGLVKTGAGTLTLSGSNTFSGATLINAGKLLINGSLAAGSAVTVASGGALGGTGVIHGLTMVQVGGTLSPGTSIGTLTISNSLTLMAGGTNLFEISKSPLTNDVVRISGTLAMGGTLRVTNIAGTLAVGDSFKLFAAGTYSGNFQSLLLPPPGPGLGWNTNLLNSAGIISVVNAAPPTPPQFGSVTLQGGNFIFTGTGGVADGSYYVLTATNVTIPMAMWTRLATNAFNSNGDFGFTNALDVSAPQQYFRLQLP
ncbi:MAG: autotransporter-associated beta strand repeat-containing protein, partial [Akkermansiaceae bacterium]|nr:autotransporter-associated beta strand repeat-containing protein [Verrucomicrobiales bacterium]